MRYPRTPLALILTALLALLTLFTGPTFAGDCMRLCDPSFM